MKRSPNLKLAVGFVSGAGNAGNCRGCLFLASDEASCVTGAELAIDGGYLAQ